MPCSQFVVHGFKKLTELVGWWGIHSTMQYYMQHNLIIPEKQILQNGGSNTSLFLSLGMKSLVVCERLQYYMCFARFLLKYIYRNIYF